MAAVGHTQREQKENSRHGAQNHGSNCRCRYASLIPKATIQQSISIYRYNRALNKDAIRFNPPPVPTVDLRGKHVWEMVEPQSLIQMPPRSEKR